VNASGKILLECTGLHKTYHAVGEKTPEVHVLRGVDLRVREGEIVTILGASGSGKSTLLNILGGLDRPTSGEVLWEGKPYYAMGEEERAAARGRFIGFVFQIHHLLNEFTALENVMIPAMIARVPPKEAAGRAAGLLREVGLGGRLDHRPAELSGGEQQRVAVARALVNRPAIVLADEPSGNLDSENSRQLSDLIARLHASHRQSFVIVTHNRQFTPDTDRTFTMTDGMLVRVTRDP
jgi:lipoprotein-releasing system ATP-binding protein